MSESGDSSIFAGGDVFEQRELLRVGHVPDIDRVVGRDDEISDVGRALGPGTRGGPPETTIIYGKTGTGKSLVTRCVCRQARREAQSHETHFQFSYVDCSDYQTDAKASREMARQLSEGLDADADIPRVGIAASDYRDITWELLEEYGVDVFVVVLDEVDKLDDDELLRSLTRARESSKSDAHIGAICVSNKIEYRDRLNERLDSSLQENELVFDPCDILPRLKSWASPALQRLSWVFAGLQSVVARRVGISGRDPFGLRRIAGGATLPVLLSSPHST